MSKPIKQEPISFNMSNEEVLATILKQSGKPWILDVIQAMEVNGIEPQKLIESLFLLGNIRRFTGWGKITWLIQDKEVVRIDQEQGFKYK